MEVLRSSAFIAAICSEYSISANIFIGIVFVNNNIASSDTVLKPLMLLNALRRYTEDSAPLIIPTESASDHIGKAYSIIDVTAAEIIRLLNGLGPLIFGIILANAPCVTDAFSAMYFTRSLKFNLLSIIDSRFFILFYFFDSIFVPPTITSIFSCC